MGQKVNPISNRLGIIRGWDSNWFGGSNYGDTLVEDDKIRKYLNERLAKASVARIVIERTLKLVTITICTARPGIIIGKQGADVEALKQELIKLTKELTDQLRRNRTVDWDRRDSARAHMRMLVKRLLKKYKYPPDEAKGALETVMRQCELWVDETEYESKAEAALPQRGV